MFSGSFILGTYFDPLRWFAMKNHMSPAMRGLTPEVDAFWVWAVLVAPTSTVVFVEASMTRSW